MKNTPVIEYAIGNGPAAAARIAEIKKEVRLMKERKALKKRIQEILNDK